MARYIDADALKLDIDLSQGATIVDLAISVIKAVKEAPTADVVPKSEVAKEVLLDLKRQIHEKAVYVHSRDTYTFVNLNVFDSVLNNVIKKYTEGKNDGS